MKRSPASVATALGLEFHLDDHYVTSTKAAVEAFHKAFDNLVNAQKHTPLLFFIWFGHANWINYTVGKIPMARYRHLMNCARSIAADQAVLNSWHAPLQTPLESSVLDEIKQLTEVLQTAQRFTACHDVPSTILWTDACTTGLGMVAANRETCVGVNVALPIPQNKIFLGEILAGYAGSLTFYNNLKETDFVWAVDNTAAGRALIKGHSASASADELLLLWIQSGCVPTHVMLVPTACQRADLLSRGTNIIPPACTHSHLLRHRRFVLT